MSNDEKAKIYLEDALQGLKQLSLSKETATCSRETARKPRLFESEVDASEGRRCRSRSFCHRLVKSRYAPYRLPVKRSSSCGSRDSDEESETPTQEKSKKTATCKPTVITCTQEALGMGQDCQSTSLVREDAEVDELSEYFARFVGVQSKMSPLAESMYA